ncbi:cAMP-dependent protein kinase inhibitor beta [Callorhinchus milii]|uniref:cAMP-dependent protein kinase inhibitor beta-like protein n=1 Tax=Callorhinchus milii TaxID=7868 RepID=K4G5J6_CALMI|nr:cAMP-dependent protein kinase inhibitor beta [Callorhinchus milii]AFK10853.1 cAMP-dependent protein kinase inhibitor beta-like protein [Callorhinchus milii]AFM86711.1 cAMP-dependent protein kinase inhibitor beta-like protein [Callorhinchus milii]AFM86976.1 cAMP-dependent protein kinase inhibitor beta-like protein [Callorhinchus milii]|eukprot:gi/632962739/ref/XP_007897488.1/ PREDICTED: cAMP-dependent protein kinase inhibitor beta [Callorhinchus milii]
MTDVEAVVTDFAASERAGRRNALPDISSTGSSSVDLSHKLSQLSLSTDSSQEGEGTEGKAPASEPPPKPPENQETSNAS